MDEYERLDRARTEWDATGSLDAFIIELNGNGPFSRQWRNTLAAILSGEIKRPPRPNTLAQRNKAIRAQYRATYEFWKSYQKYAKSNDIKHKVAAYRVTPADFAVVELARLHGLKSDAIRLILKGYRKKGNQKKPLP
jgi:hypothetical protein